MREGCWQRVQSGRERGEAWRDSRRDGGRGGHASVFWLLSKGSVASSEQTKSWSQLNITVVSFRAQAFGEVVEAWEGGCVYGGDVLSLCNAPWPARGYLKQSVALITRRSGSAPLFDYLLGFPQASHLSLLPPCVTLSPLLLSLCWNEQTFPSPVPCVSLSCMTNSTDDSLLPLIPNIFHFLPQTPFTSPTMNYRCRRWTLIIYRAANAAGEWKLNIGFSSCMRREASHAWPA